MTDTGGPVIESNLVLALHSLSDRRLSRLSGGDGTRVLRITILHLGLSVLLVESRRTITLAGAPVLKVLRILSLLRSLSSRLGILVLLCNLDLLSQVHLSVCLDHVAVLESALNPVEEITYELSLVHLIDALKKLGVHLLLEILVHINLKVSLEESSLAQGLGLHVSIHAHLFDLGEHLSLRFSLDSFSRVDEHEGGKDRCELHFIVIIL